MLTWRTRAIHNGDGFTFTVPQVKHLVDLANRSDSTEESPGAGTVLARRADVAGNHWSIKYKKDSKGLGKLTLEINRPECHLDYHGGIGASIFGPEIYWKKRHEFQFLDDFEVKMLKLEPGESKIWTIGNVPEVYKSCDTGVLVVRVNVAYYNQRTMVPKRVIKITPTVSEIKEKDKIQMAVRTGELTEEGDKFADFNVKVPQGLIGTKSFSLHKAILAARVPVIKKLFADGASDSEVADKMTRDISSRTMEILVHYIYKGEFLPLLSNDKVETLEQLLETADKWGIPELKPFLDSKVIDYLTLENAHHLFELCTVHRLTTAEKDVSRFIAKNIRQIMALGFKETKLIGRKRL